MPAIDGDGQEPRTESPTVQPEQSPVAPQPTQPVDTGAASDQTAAPETSRPSEGEPAGDRPRDEQGRFAPKDSKPATPDPVTEAIDRLVKKSEPKTPEQPGKVAADKAPPSAKAPDAAKPVNDEGLKNRTNDDLDMPPEERARLRRDTAERFDRVLSAARTAREELEKSTPFIEQGKGYSKILDEFDLHADMEFVPPEHFAGVVKAQASVNRALIAIHQGRQPAPSDVEAFTELATTIDKLRSQLGVQSPAPQSPSIQPFTGELPQDLKDMVDIYGFDEKRARMLAALEAKAPAPAQPVAQPPVAPAPPAPAKEVGVDMGQLYSRKFLAELHEQGVQNPQEQMRVLLKHPQTRQEVIKRFPGITVAMVPEIFDSLDAPTRYDILKSAHKALTTVPVPARLQSPPPATSNRGIPTTAMPRRAAPDTNGDPVVAAIAHLARE